MRTHLVVNLLVAAAWISSHSFAAEAAPQTPKRKKKEAAMLAVAAPAPLPALPPPPAEAPPPPAAAPVTALPVVAPGAVERDRIAATPSTTRRETSGGTGLLIAAGAGVAYAGGEAFSGVDARALLTTVDVRLGGYLTRHLGVMGGARGSFGTSLECRGCSARAYQFPLVAQYAVKGSAAGLYFEGGVAFLPTHVESVGKDAQAIVIEVSGVVDLKTAIGYRLPVKNPLFSKTAVEAVEIRLGADIGRYTSASVSSEATTLAGGIDPERHALHYSAGLTLGYQLSP